MELVNLIALVFLGGGYLALAVAFAKLRDIIIGMRNDYDKAFYLILRELDEK